MIRRKISTTTTEEEVEEGTKKINGKE